jgi:hypothetical protein
MRYMSMESHGGMTLTGKKTEKVGEKRVPVPVCSPQIVRGLSWTRTRASAVGVKFTIRVTNSFSGRPLSTELIIFPAVMRRKVHS